MSKKAIIWIVIIILIIGGIYTYNKSPANPANGGKWQPPFGPGGTGV